MSAKRPLALDLFCGAGGATKGLQRAGFRVTGVDIKPQPNYCGDFMYVCDFMKWAHGTTGAYDFVWASPPCQQYTLAKRIRGRTHVDLIEEVRRRLIQSGAPYCIENVVGAPLRKPTMLCGGMFGLRTYRHRLFETSFPLEQPWHGPHAAKQTKMGRTPKEGEFIQVVGNFSGAQTARDAMGIDWMTRAELSESIPPAYSEFIGRAALNVILRRAAA